MRTLGGIKAAKPPVVANVPNASLRLYFLLSISGKQTPPTVTTPAVPEPQTNPKRAENKAADIPSPPGTNPIQRYTVVKRLSPNL